MLEGAPVKREGERVRQFAVLLQNRVGSLGSLVRMVRSHKVEIIGLSMQDSRDATVARMVVTDADAVEQLFIEKGIPHAVCDIVVVGLRESGEGLARCLDVLKAGETNVDFAYSMMAHPDRQALLALHLEDYDFGSDILCKAGFKLLYQEDLSR